MYKNRFFLVTTVVLAIYIFMVAGSSRGTVSINVDGACPTGDCADAMKDCKKPREVHSTDPFDGCACFVCEKGTRNQHLKCTKDENDKTKMFELIRLERPDVVVSTRLPTTSTRIPFSFQQK